MAQKLNTKIYFFRQQNTTAYFEKVKTEVELTLAAEETCVAGIGRFDSWPKSIVISYNILRVTQADTRRFGNTFSVAEIVSLE